MNEPKIENEQNAKLVAQCRELEAKATKGPIVAVGGYLFTENERGPVAPLQHGYDAEMTDEDAALLAFLRNHAIPLCNALEAAQKENAELTKRLEAARVALEAAERHRWAARNLEAISDPLDDRLLGLKMDVERTASEANILRKAALETLNQPLP